MRPPAPFDAEPEREEASTKSIFAGWNTGIWFLRAVGIVVIALGIGVGIKFADLAGVERGWVFLLTSLASIGAGCLIIFIAEIPNRLSAATDKGSGGVIWCGRLLGAVIMGLGMAVGINQARDVANGEVWWFLWAGLSSIAIGILLLAVSEILDALRRS